MRERCCLGQNREHFPHITKVDSAGSVTLLSTRDRFSPYKRDLRRKLIIQREPQDKNSARVSGE